jgi:hypothetical protein
MSEPADLPSLSWGNDREIYVVFCKVSVRFLLRVWEEQNDELHCTLADRWNQRQTLCLCDTYRQGSM